MQRAPAEPGNSVARLRVCSARGSSGPNQRALTIKSRRSRALAPKFLKLGAREVLARQLSVRPNQQPPRPRRRNAPSGTLLEELERLAEQMELIASASRIALLEALRAGEASVQELADELDLDHRNASHHLVLLRRAGVVSRRSEGTASLYSISDWTLLWVVDQMRTATSGN